MTLTTLKENPLCLSGLKWCWEESNCRHKDFQSFALPSELQHHFAFGIAKIYKFDEVAKKNLSFFCFLQNLAIMINIAFEKDYYISNQ